MQRLFSTFADGWPGTGLLLLRLLAGAALIRHGIASLRDTSHLTLAVAQIIGAVAGVLLIGGLWTPVAGALAAIVETWIAWSHISDPWVAIMSATVGAALAMVGPGAWSLDARLFGRKHIDLPER